MRDKEIKDYKKAPVQTEFGIKADLKLVDELVDEISSSWGKDRPRPVKPILLLLGGFQGSGKSTVIEELQKEAEDSFIVIVPDEIRSKLFEKIPFSTTFIHTVFAARNKLLQIAIKTRQHIVMDENSTPLRVNIFNSFVDKQEGSEYRVLTVYLDASKEVLVQRVEHRPQVSGRYAGKIDELLASIEKHGDIDLDSYEMVIDTEKVSPETVANRIFDTIQSLQ